MIKTRAMWRGALMLLTGCAGPMFEGTIFEQPAASGTHMAAPAAARPDSHEFRQLAEQLAAVNRGVELLNARVGHLEAQLGGGARTQEELVALRRDIHLLRAERDSLRQEITNDLAGRVERIAAQQARPAAPASVAAASASAAPGARSGYEHVVEKGQTLSEIARGYGKSMDAIMKANKIANPSHIRVGQRLFIPD